MAADDLLNILFRWHPWPIPDPGPEVYAIFRSLPADRQLAVAREINAARSQMDTIRADTYGKIGEIIGGKAGQ